jgi:nucleoid-associated protein YgaU
VIGQFLKAASRSATRSGVSASIFCAGFLFAAAASAAAQVPATDTVKADTVRADTAVRMQVISDTTKEVKHVVKKGDTLWDLAQFYLKDPFRWPEIFRRNTDVVENPHWIYPGEVIRIWGSEVRPEALVRADSAGEVVSHIVAQPTTALTGVPQRTNASGRSNLTVFASPLSQTVASMTEVAATRARAGAVRRGEVEAAPYTDRQGGPKDTGRLIASVDRPGIKTSMIQQRYQLNDALFVDMPKGYVPRLGDTYMSYVLGPDLAQFGQVVVPTGILRIERIPSGQRTIARIIRQFGEIMLGQPMIVAPDVTFPGGAVTPVVGGITGKVLYVLDEPVLPSIGHYTIISPNSKAGLKVGDEITFIDNTAGPASDSHAPPVVAGTGVVVRATPYSTTVIILRQEQPTIRDGTPVRVTATTP